MSRIIAAAAIRGAHKIINRAEKKLNEIIEKYGKDQEVAFPNTGYYLPVIYGMTAMKVETVGDMEKVMAECRKLLPPLVKERHWFPFLGWALDAGMATLFAEEIIEAIKYLETPDLYVTGSEPVADNIWLGAANDVILRERGIEFVDGTAPGFAAIVGAAPTNEWAVRIARELQEKNLYIFMSADNDGVSMAEQLKEEGVQLGWPTRLVSFGKDISATVFSLGFATRAALSFGGIQPGDYSRILMYNRSRVFAFVLPLMEVDDEKYANAAGAINWGFPTIAHTDIPQILPTGVCMYEHVVSSIPLEEIVNRAVEVRGLKVQVSKVDVPVPFGPAFEGETVRKEDMYVEFNSTRAPYPSFEYVRSLGLDQVEDGKIEVIGPEIDDTGEGSQMPLGIVVEVAGRQMQPDFEPILERMIHTYINEASGVFHMGQRNLNWIRISKEAQKKGFKIKHFGTIIHAKFHEDYGAILDKVQVKIYTEEGEVREWLEIARRAYRQRDERLAGLADEGVDVYYSCTLCQSFAPNHVCIITPERSGLCGGYTWLDGKANYQIVPTGPNQPVRKGMVLNTVMGEWEGVNDFLKVASRGNLSKFKAYSIMEDPMTSCVVGNTELVINGEPVKISEFFNRHYGGDSYVGSSALTLREGKAQLESIVALQRFPAPDVLIQLKTKSGAKLTLTPEHEIAVDRVNGMQWIRAEQIAAGDRILSLRNLEPEIEADYFLDIVTDVKAIRNNDEYDYVYNLTLADTHCYFANGALIKNCGCFECISVILPLTNGMMIVDRDFLGMTPCGTKFSTLAGMVGAGRQTPGFVGHSKLYIASKKFIVGDGGFKRIAWMPRALKEQVGNSLNERARAEGIDNFLDMIADETIANTEDEVMEYMAKVGHPALEMEPMMK